jgi:hypothetical protein
MLEKEKSGSIAAGKRLNEKHRKDKFPVLLKGVSGLALLSTGLGQECKSNANRKERERKGK